MQFNSTGRRTGPLFGMFISVGRIRHVVAAMSPTTLQSVQKDSSMTQCCVMSEELNVQLKQQIVSTNWPAQPLIHYVQVGLTTRSIQTSTEAYMLHFPSSRASLALAIPMPGDDTALRREVPWST